MNYCGCDIQLQSTITVSDEGEPDEHALAWEALYVPSASDERDPNKAPTEVAPSFPEEEQGEPHSIPETPHGAHEQGDVSPQDPAMGIAVRVDAKERMTQTPPLLSRLIQGYLDHTRSVSLSPDGPLLATDTCLSLRSIFLGHPHRVNKAQYLLVSVWSLGHMRIILAFGVESRQSSAVLPCLQSCFEDLRALTGGPRPPILRLHSDKASEFLTPTIRAYLSQQGVRQTVNSGYDPQGNGEVRATALLADVRLPPDYWSYACRWVAYVHTHRVTEIPINKALPHFGDVVVMHHAFKKPPSFENRGTTGVCLGWPHCWWRLGGVGSQWGVKGSMFSQGTYLG